MVAAATCSVRAVQHATSSLYASDEQMLDVRQSDISSAEATGPVALHSADLASPEEAAKSVAFNSEDLAFFDASDNFAQAVQSAVNHSQSLPDFLSHLTRSASLRRVAQGLRTLGTSRASADGSNWCDKGYLYFCDVDAMTLSTSVGLNVDQIRLISAALAKKEPSFGWLPDFVGGKTGITLMLQIKFTQCWRASCGFRSSICLVPVVKYRASTFQQPVSQKMVEFHDMVYYFNKILNPGLTLLKQGEELATYDRLLEGLWSGQVRGTLGNFNTSASTRDFTKKGVRFGIHSFLEGNSYWAWDRNFTDLSAHKFNMISRQPGLPGFMAGASVGASSDYSKIIVNSLYAQKYFFPWLHMNPQDPSSIPSGFEPVVLFGDVSKGCQWCYPWQFSALR